VNPDAKSAVRREIRQLLRGTTPEDRAAWSAQMVRRLAALPVFLESRTILLFAALPTEPDFLSLLGEPAETGRKLVFPRVAGDELVLHSVDSAEQLSAGSARVREPSPERPIVDPSAVDFALVPGQAFDAATGIRLGRGGGYYDRLLVHPSFHGFTLGVCFSLQLRRSLPAEPHDVPVRAVLTERGLA